MKFDQIKSNNEKKNTFWFLPGILKLAPTNQHLQLEQKTIIQNLHVGLILGFHVGFWGCILPSLKLT